MVRKLVVIATFASAVVFAHCDSVEGPVVQAARRALSNDDVNLVLPWVPPNQEETIRQAFARTKAVRSLGRDAEQIADTWFYETAVRIHRAGEGAPYEGLKEADAVPAGIAAADAAISEGDIQALETELATALASGLRQRFSHLLELKSYQLANVTAGRKYVAAYVDFIHFVERLDSSLKTGREHAHEHE